MNKILRSHPNIVIGATAIVLVAVMAAFYIWAIDDIFVEFHLALAPPVPQGVAGFGIGAAQKLDLRGLVSSSSLPATVATSSLAATTTTATAPSQ